VVGDLFEHGLARDVFVRARLGLAPFRDLSSWVDRDGLHFNWRGGRGQLNVLPKHLTQDDREHTIVVALPGPVRALPKRGTRRPALVADVIAELAYF